MHKAQVKHILLLSVCMSQRWQIAEMLPHTDTRWQIRCIILLLKNYRTRNTILVSLRFLRNGLMLLIYNINNEHLKRYFDPHLKKSQRLESSNWCSSIPLPNSRFELQAIFYDRTVCCTSGIAYAHPLCTREHEHSQRGTCWLRDRWTIPTQCSMISDKWEYFSKIRRNVFVQHTLADT